MLESLKLLWHRGFATLDGLVNKYSPLILCGLLALTTFQKLTLILHADGGGDLLGADIPKSMMLMAGQNPYSSNPWASPYPPFLLAMVGSIIRVTSGSIMLTPATIGLISRNVRMAGLLADAIVALLVFLALRARRVSGLSALVPSALLLTLPSISLSPYYWFNSDVFGYPILAGSVLALIAGRYFVGSSLLATSTIFKIHPILAIPLVLVWLVRRSGFPKSLPTVITTGSILVLGLVVPVILPGYLICSWLQSIFWVRRRNIEFYNDELALRNISVPFSSLPAHDRRESSLVGCDGITFCGRAWYCVVQSSRA